MNCTHCNSPLAPEATFCSVCGTPIQQAPQQADSAPQQNAQQQPGSASPSQGTYQQAGTASQQGFQQQPGFGGYAQPKYGAPTHGYAQPGYGAPMYGTPVSIPPGYCQKQLKQYQKLGWFLGGIGLHDFYAGYMNKGFLHAVFTKVALFSFLLSMFISEASEITIYEDSYSYHQAMRSQSASASEVFCGIFLFASLIIFAGNAIWAIIETVTVKTDSNQIPMN